ncbi:MAG: PAS domain-containing protein [Alphaproteobacteria bacterium]|nr:PAS domain-containing protein [Alphaproteobacteria bacterium]
MSKHMIPFRARGDGRIAGGDEAVAGGASRHLLATVRPLISYRDYARSLPNVPVLAPMALIDCPEDITHPQFRQLFDLWDELRGGRAFPARQDFALPSLVFLFGNLMLVDIVGDSARLRFRLVGTQIVNRLGSDPTGQWFEPPLAGSYLAPILAVATSVLSHRAPRMALRNMTPGQASCRFELLVVPLSDDGQAINMLMAALVPARVPPVAAPVARPL